MGRGRVICVSWLLVLSLAALSVQSSSDAPTLRAGTTLVEFTVVVTADDGKPITDLKQEDFAVVEQGLRTSSRS